MNIFEQYGIKEIADVCLYAIELDENDDEVYIPVLYLDTLKVSTIEETAEQTSARGGLGNPELIIWDYGKEITVTLEDALYSPASQGMTWGGEHGSKKVSLYGNFLTGQDMQESYPAKIIIDNFSDYDYSKNVNNGQYKWTSNIQVVSLNGEYRYYKEKVGIGYAEASQSWGFTTSTGQESAIQIEVTKEDGTTEVVGIFVLSTDKNKGLVPPQEAIYQINNAIQNVYFLDRIEKCKATQTFVIDTDANTRHGNYRYLEKYSQCELTVFIDPRTMQPYEPNTDSFIRKNGEEITGNLRIIKQHEVYYKWTRTKAIDETSLGHQIVIDPIHFPGTYRLVGETYSRAYKNGKDQRFQFEIPLCKMGTENNLSLEAEGDPTTFNMTLKVLRREDGTMMKLTQYSVEKAKFDKYYSDSTDVVPISKVSTDVDEIQMMNGLATLDVNTLDLG